MRRSGDLYDGVPGYGPTSSDLGSRSPTSGLKARCRLIVLLSSGLDREQAHRLMDTAA
jgi:hypothetical protein